MTRALAPSAPVLAPPSRLRWWLAPGGPRKPANRNGDRDIKPDNPPPAGQKRQPTRKGQPQFCSRCGGEGHNRNSKKCPRLGGSR